MPKWLSRVCLALLLSCFLILVSLLPLGTAIQIGGDEGYELAKATLCLRGFKLYTEIWNDQPPLHTLLNKQLLKLTAGGGIPAAGEAAEIPVQSQHYERILWPRLFTVAFGALLIAALFLTIEKLSAVWTATLACAILIASPGVLGLAASCMLELPALSLAVGALCLLAVRRSHCSHALTALAGVVFGLSLLTKLISLTLFPAVVAAACVVSPPPHASRQLKLLETGKRVFYFAVYAFLSFLAADLILEKGAYLTHFHQSWTSHFAPSVSSEYGSAAEHPFPWTVLLKHWDATLPATLGLGFLVFNRKFRTSNALLPFLWLGASLVIFGFHKPWWSYYYIHIAVPLAWCAATSIVLLQKAVKRDRIVVGCVFAYAAASLFWTGSRLYLQIANARNSPQTFSSPVLTEMARYRPFTELLYTDDPIYSFHADIPLPPNLAVIMLKRLWSGEMTNDKIAAEVATLKPGLILLGNDSRSNPLKNLLESQYNLVYVDDAHRLYAHKSIASKPSF
ncbi:MAG TPA: hypothetical protein VLT36_04585 [Candidatus Dormibacteraeota bacterium]|nr:hypothetical protein [Candidatus Dormibacteraeota bacterium]